MPLLKRNKYKKPKLPEGPFMLVQDELEEGPYYGDDFTWDRSQGFAYATTAGRPVFLRITDQTGNELQLEDGGGNPYTVSVVLTQIQR